MRTVGLALLLAAGALLGFVATLRLIPENTAALRSRALAPVAVDMSFSARSARPEALVAGWATPEDWGVWSKDAEATVAVRLLGAAAGDVMLFIEGRGRSPQQAEKASVAVLVNGSPVGHWQLTGRAGETASFVVSAEVTNREFPVRIAFRTAGAASFGLKRLVLRDVSALTGFVGVLDSCEATRIAGWAKAEDLPSPVAVRRGGQTVTPIAVRNVHRPDLPAHGIPAAAGFDITLPQPLDPAHATEVLLPNGRPLGNSPCKSY